MKKFILIKFLLFCFLSVFSQDRTITGIVKSSDGRTMENVTVSLSGTQKSVLTDKSGHYSITVPSSGSVLVFTHIGYVKQEVNVAGKNVLNVTLESETVSLGDVVVVGYGTQRKKDVTVSIEKVSMQDLNKAPVRSFVEALAGRVAGMQVTSNDGQPGTGSRIVIRGNNSITQDNSPLYIIDGFPLEGPNSNILNPEDIESIEVLKDASATAIYGSRGSNGVIMITTKKGKEGPPVLSFSASYGFQEATKRMEMMTPYDFVRYQVEKDSVASKLLYLTNPGKTLDDYKNLAGLDWQSKVLRVAPMKNYSLSLSGGSANTKYMISGSITDQDGIIINSNYTRYQGKISLDQTVNKHLKVGINTNYSFLKQSGITVAGANGGTISSSTNLMYAVWGYRPLQSSNSNIEESLIDPDLNYANDYRINPYLNLQNALNNRFTKSLIANAYAEYSILPDLKLRVTGGINTNTLRQDIFNNSKTQTGNPYAPSGLGVNGSVTYNEANTWVNENILTWNKKISKQQTLTLVGVASLQGGKSNAYGATAIQVPNESLGISGLDQGTPQSISSTTSEWTLASFAARANYNLMSKYYFTASYRADGSSRFAEGRRWGYFPAASFAWRFKNEAFFKKIRVLSDAKLRIGYGANGNNRVGDFAYLSTITLPISSSYTINNAIVRGSIPSTFGNASLKWETTYETNIGLDLALFQSRINFTAEVYRKKTKDLLLNASLPASSGYSSAYKNIGSVQNQGLEFTLNTTNIRNNTFTWTSSFNIAFNKNKVLALTENQEVYASSAPFDNTWASVTAYMAKLNNPLGQMIGYIWDGVYQYSDFYKNTAGAYVLKSEVPTNGNTRDKIQPGDIKYKDINGDGVININDYAVIGNGIPKHNGGFSNNFTYKGFDLNIFLQWSYGNDIMNVNKFMFEGNALGKNTLNQYASYNNRWSPTNTSSNIFRTGGFFGDGYSSYIIEDGSYLRLKTVALGYTIPASVLKRAKIKSFRLYVSAQNLFTWTNYSGMDPEVNIYNSAVTPGFDWSAYPRAKTITFGANLSL